MQEPVSKDLLSKNNELGKFKEVVQEKDVLLRNNRARIKELEQQVEDLKNENRAQADQLLAMDSMKSQMEDYERFYSKIMTDSEQLVQEKLELQNRFNELEEFCRDLLEKYEKAKAVVEEFEKQQDALQKQLTEYEQKSSTRSSFERLSLLREQEKREASMFEPLQGLN
ncbi:hypothetical protein GWI33_004244 [Rhynchophorus ferrugineus]|uniref:Uncharacterized protein n=1 Tax=Rhynchophorus ferrugineus TaxID=354439 RepID=A0A834IJ31_RHYFE|nr:hypothetical protein GWI33_004244 [Rhynchophorus ferrugineus]